MIFREILDLSKEEIEASSTLIGKDVYAGIFLLPNSRICEFSRKNLDQLLSPTRISFYSIKSFDVDVYKVCKVYGKSCHSGILGLLLFFFDYILMMSVRLKLKLLIRLGLM